MVQPYSPGELGTSASDAVVGATMSSWLTVSRLRRSMRSSDHEAAPPLRLDRRLRHHRAGRRIDLQDAGILPRRGCARRPQGAAVEHEIRAGGSDGEID